jgi:hypothetical protein
MIDVLDTALPDALRVLHEQGYELWAASRPMFGTVQPKLGHFSVFDTRRGAYLSLDEMRAFVASLGLSTVPIEREVRGDEARSFEHTLERYLAMANGVYAGTKNRREGIVVRPLVDRVSRTLGGRLSFKVLNNDFLLKDED